MIRDFGVDAYFLDIAGAWENNRKADMHEGTRALVAELAARHPGVPPIGEMLYDAQMAFIPMSQVVRYPAPSGRPGRLCAQLRTPEPACAGPRLDGRARGGLLRLPALTFRSTSAPFRP